MASFTKKGLTDAVDNTLNSRQEFDTFTCSQRSNLRSAAQRSNLYSDRANLYSERSNLCSANCFNTSNSIHSENFTTASPYHRISVFTPRPVNSVHRQTTIPTVVPK